MKKLVLASTVAFLVFVTRLRVQNQSDSIRWPVPENVPGLLFYIQRDPDINTVCYTINLLTDGSVDQVEPVEIFWTKYATNGSKKKLNTLQRKFGYGLSVTRQSQDRFLLKSVAFPNRRVLLVKRQEKGYEVQMKIRQQNCVLKRVYIRITGGTRLSPDVAYIEFYGVDHITQQQLSERVIFSSTHPNH